MVDTTDFACIDVWGTYTIRSWWWDIKLNVINILFKCRLCEVIKSTYFIATCIHVYEKNWNISLLPSPNKLRLVNGRVSTHMAVFSLNS